MKILAIETSCDETAIALVKCKGTLRQAQGSKLSFKVLKSIISSQVKVHQPFHGVVPNLAKREHIKNLPKILKKLGKFQTDYIAVTVGPGLEPALWAGINFSEEFSKKIKKPLIGVNHMEGHVYSNWLPKVSGVRYPVSGIKFPAIVLIVSGGHTILLKMEKMTKWINLGETLDDAAGEAFDKVARMLNLKYPGGPEIQKLAVRGNPKAIQFPRPMLNKKNYSFSFSGLKTSVLYYLRDHPKAKKADVAASFQQAVTDVLVKKTLRAAKEYKAKSVLLCGGVAANKSLRSVMEHETKEMKLKFFAPGLEFNTDNAVMIASAAYINLLQKNKKRLKIEAQGNLGV